MARDRNTPDRYSTALGRLMLGALVVMLLGLFLLWRIDSPRVERLRMEITDRVIPNFATITAPVTSAVNILRSARSYTRIYQQNQELRRELQQMKAWKEGGGRRAVCRCCSALLGGRRRTLRTLSITAEAPLAVFRAGAARG